MFNEGYGHSAESYLVSPGIIASVDWHGMRKLSVGIRATAGAQVQASTGASEERVV